MKNKEAKESEWYMNWGVGGGGIKSPFVSDN